MSPIGSYQYLGSPPIPSSPPAIEDAGEAIIPLPEPPVVAELQQINRRMVGIVTGSSALTVAFSGLTGVGYGEDNLKVLITGAAGLGLSLTVTALALLCGRETYTEFRIGDHRAIVLSGLVTSALLGLAAVGMASGSSSGSV